MAKLKSYAEKLLDPRWQRKRLEVLQRDGFVCQNCSSRDKTLHVHHKCYLKGVEIWDYQDQYYQTLCVDCHKTITMQNDYINQCIALALTHTFEKDCFVDVLRTINFSHLIFAIWENKDWLEDISEALNTDVEYLTYKHQPA